MKKLVLLLSLLITPILIFSQTPITNGGMENWVNIGASNEEPTEWNSNKTGSGFASSAPQTLFRETGVANIHSGTYSARIRTTTYFGTPVNGVMTVGEVNAPTFTPSDGYNETVQVNANFYETVTSVPDSIVFWAKYVPQDITDSARVSVIIHDAYDLDDPQEASGSHVRAKAVKNFRTGGVYVRMAVPFSTLNAGVTPLYILATFTSSKTPGVGTSNTILYIDDISLIYNPPVITTGIINPLIYYVSSSQGAAVSVPYTVTGTVVGGNVFTAQLSNSAGSFASPVSIGTLVSTGAGTISGTIPAGTASGTGYRIRTTSSTPVAIGSTNVSDIEVVLVSNSIAPVAVQTLEANTNGTTLNVTQTAGALSQEWKYATISGGPYSSFGVAETGTSYIPNFASFGPYYVVCETTYPNGIVVRSNEVLVNVVDNNVTPSGSQSLLVGVNGTMLTVTETPAGTAREWKFATISGGPYSSFGPLETGMTYTPNFAAPGTYYVVCISTISGVTCTSNEVVISVGTATLATGTIVGSPFEFSPNAPDANINVPYTVSTPLGAGNIFTAQLSDASGSFVLPVNIGSVGATGSGSISATISHLTADGNAYRIRVVSSSPVILGSDNGTDIVIDQFDNSASPSTTQNILYNVNGTTINVSESQPSTRNWKYSIISGGPYSVFSLAQTSSVYTPNFPAPGTYYVVCVSTNTYSDTVVSNETQINVSNGTTLNTSSGPTAYYISLNAAVTDNIAFTSDVIFNPGNIFTAEISDASGSFAFPISLGTLSSTTVSPIAVNIPNGLASGSAYRIRVTSSSPAITGTDNGANILVAQFANSAVLPDTQYVGAGLNGNTLNVTSTHPTSITHEWKYKVGINFVSFAPAETGTSYTPNFAATGTYPIACFSVNQWNDTVQTNIVMIYVVPGSGINGENDNNISLIWNNQQLAVNLTNSDMMNPKMEILNMSGQVIMTRILNPHSISTENMVIPAGAYICRIIDVTNDAKIYTQKFIKP